MVSNRFHSKLMVEINNENVNLTSQMFVLTFSGL